MFAAMDTIASAGDQTIGVDCQVAPLIVTAEPRPLYLGSIFAAKSFVVFAFLPFLIAIFVAFWAIYTRLETGSWLGEENYKSAPPSWLALFAGQMGESAFVEDEAHGHGGRGANARGQERRKQTTRRSASASAQSNGGDRSNGDNKKKKKKNNNNNGGESAGDNTDCKTSAATNAKDASSEGYTATLWTRSYVSILTLTMMFHPSLTSQVFSFFKCTKAVAGRRLLDSDVNIVCSSECESSVKARMLGLLLLLRLLLLLIMRKVGQTHGQLFRSPQTTNAS